VSPGSGGQGVVWLARLWGDQADGGAEAKDPAVHEPIDPTSSSPPPLTGEGGGRYSSRGPRTTGRSDGCCDERTGPKPSSGEEDEHEECDVLYTGKAADADDDLVRVEEVDFDEESFSNDEDRDDDPSRDAEGRETYRFSIPSTVISESDLRAIDGVVDDPPVEEPPLPAVFADRRLVYVLAERVPGAGAPRSVVGMGLGMNGSLMSKPIVTIVGGRAEAALVRQVLAVTSTASKPVVFATPHARVVKQLLQPHRRVRAPILFGLVNELHGEVHRLGLHVEIAGGLPVPRDLRRAVWTALRDESAARASIATARETTSRFAGNGR